MKVIILVLFPFLTSAIAKANPVSMDNKQKEVRDSLLKKSVLGIGRTAYEIYDL